MVKERSLKNCLRQQQQQQREKLELFPIPTCDSFEGKTENSSKWFDWLLYYLDIILYKTLFTK